MVSAECEPFAKTGGLADVVDALSRALGRLGHEVDVYLPRYRGVEPPAGSDRRTLSVPIGVRPGDDNDAGDRATVDLITGQADGYRIRLVDHPWSYDRPDFYVDADGDYADNAARFALLGRTALETMRREGAPDILHGHDWQSAPAILLAQHRYAADLAALPAVMTCHNLAYHGWTPRDRAWMLDLPATVGQRDGVDLLREGIAAADVANTVSPTFAVESRTPEFGAGLHDLFVALGDRYTGVLNGLDTELWDPATDEALPARFDLDDPSGKAACKRELCARLGLALAEGEEPWDERGAPRLGLVGRLDPQKGFDLLTSAAAQLLDLGARVVVLGTGDARLVTDLQRLAAERPDRLVVIARFDRDEARRIYAASDIFLMPSRFEPSGQGQMIALRYGSVPLVRRTGGLADTIRDADEDEATSNGFVFGPPDPDAFMGAARRAIAAYHDEPRWDALIRRGMREDFGWERPARQYVELYERARAYRESVARP